MTKPFSIMELLARVAALLRRVQPPQPPAGHVQALSDTALSERYRLTARQIEVTRLVAEGCSNAGIADRLGVSYFTARNHIEQIILKLAVPNRAAIGAMLYGGS